VLFDVHRRCLDNSLRHPLSPHHHAIPNLLLRKIEIRLSSIFEGNKEDGGSYSISDLLNVERNVSWNSNNQDDAQCSLTFSEPIRL
jgi:hypothetical protein